MQRRTNSVLFSVVIPAYNRGAWVGEAVSSALAQVGPDFEVIVVDDGSTDDTPEVLAEYADKALVVRQENKGVSLARNSGIEASRGDWIAFLDADDRWRPGHLERLEKAILAEPEAGIVYADAMVIDAAGTELKIKRSPDPGPDPFITCLLANNITTSSAAVRRDCIDKVGGFLPGLKSGQDWDLWLRVLDSWPAVHVPEVSVDYRRQEGGTVHTRGMAMREDSLLVVSRAAKLRPDLPAGVLKKARANCYLESAVRMLAALDSAHARSELLSALRLHPAALRAWGLLFLSLGGPSAAEAALVYRRRKEGSPWA